MGGADGDLRPGPLATSRLTQARSLLYPADVSIASTHPGRREHRWLTLVVVLGVGHLAHAGDGPGAPDLEALRRRYAGEYLFVGGNTERAGVPAAVERSVDGMFFIARGIAYDRLLKSSEICTRYAFDLGAENISVAGSCRTPDVSPADGREVDHHTKQGEASKLSQRFVDQTLVQDFRGDEGARKVVWTLLADGDTLQVQVVISSKHLPRPVEYSLTYRRKDAGVQATDRGLGDAGH